MGSQLKKMKRRNQTPSPSKKDEKEFLDSYWKQAYKTGAKEQNQRDSKVVIDILKDLESVPGIGVKTAQKIKKFFADKFGVRVDDI